MDIEKAKKALINAHNAGDVLAAKKIALAIKQQEPKPSLGRTVFEQGMQGMTSGFSDEATTPLGATIATLVQEPKALFTGEVTDPALVEQLSTAPQQTEAMLSEQREKRPYTSLASNIGGSLVPAAAAGATKAGQAMGSLYRSSGTVGKIAQGMGAGAALGGLYGAGAAQEGEKLRGAGEGAISGGLVGGAIPAAGAAIRGAIPKADAALKPLVNKAREFKIPLSIDQVTESKAVKTAQKISQEVPFSGQAGFRDKQMKAFNKALFKTVGEDSDKFTPMAMDKAFMNVGRKFDKFGAGKVFDGQKLANAVKEIADEDTYATEEARGIFARNAEKLLENIKDGSIKGETLNQMRSKINAAGRKVKDSDARELLRDLEDAVIEVMADGGDETLQQAKQQYKNLLVLEPLAAKSKGGDISPTLLANRVNRIYGRSYVRGKAGDIGDLARIGNELLPELGGSDTAQKLITAGAVGGAVSNPTVGAYAALGVAGNRAMQSLVNRNQALVGAMTKQQQKELMQLPPSQAQKFLDSLRYSLTQSPAMVTNGVQ